MKSRMNKQARHEQRMAYLFIMPQYIGLFCFVLIPAIMSFILCFTKWDLIGSITFTGFTNFITIFKDERILKSLLNTLIFALGIIPLTSLVSLALALLTSREIKGLGFYKAAYFLPMATASVAIVLVWYWIFAPDLGIINFALGEIGIKGPGWLTDTFWARAAIIVMSVWQGMGYYFLIFLAGLKGIPREYYEAADIDGANMFGKFFKITVPMLSTTTFFVVVTITIGALNLFQEPVVLTQGGPEFSTYTIVMYIYDLAFKFFRMGEAAVVSIVLFILVVVITIIQFRFSRKWVYTNE